MKIFGEKKFLFPWTQVLAALLCLSLNACTVKAALDPLEPTQFITHPERLAHPKFTPFDLTWIDPLARSYRYDTLIVEAVRTDMVDRSDWIFSAGSVIPTRANYLTRVDELALYLQKVVIDRFESHRDRGRETVVQKGLPIEPSPAFPVPELQADLPQSKLMIPVEPEFRTLIVQLSISEATFGDPLVYGGLLAVPIPGVANLSTTVKAPTLTIECRFIDQASGQVLGELVDRRFPQVKVIDLNRLTIASALRELSDSFADDLVDSFYRESGEVVRRRMPFSLLPW